MNVALKEWAAVVAAMKQGRHHILLRKGGLADKDQEFRMEHSKFLFFPTYEHQKREMVAEKNHDLFEETATGPVQPERIAIDCWAEVQKSFIVSDPKILERVSQFHVWSAAYLWMRVEYKPEKPLYLLSLKIFQLKEPKTIENLRRYGGCRSWVDLGEDLDLEGSRPVSSSEKHLEIEESIESLMLQPLK